MLPIVKTPNEVLSQVAKPVSKIDSEILKLLQEMKETLEKTRDPEGVGLAAPQVGASFQIFIMKPTHKSSITVYINPTIQQTLDNNAMVSNKRPKTKSKKLEGCLSIPTIWGTVERKKQLTLTYTNEDGKTYTKEFKGFTAVIIQHEVDHLHGILFPKRVLEQKGILYKSHKDEKGEDVFEEIEI